MHHQRHSHKGQKFIEEIHRHHVFRKSNPQRHPIGERIKQKKRLLPLLVLHIFKSIQCGQRPQNSRHPAKYHTHPVNAERKRQIPRKLYNRQFISRMIQKQTNGQHRSQRHHPFQKHQHVHPFPEGQQKDQNTCKHGKQDHHKHHHRFHLDSSLPTTRAYRPETAQAHRETCLPKLTLTSESILAAAWPPPVPASADSHSQIHFPGKTPGS